MKAFGIFLLLVGLAIILYAFGMDTTVSSPLGRINNVGLMSERQNVLIAGGVLAIIGAIFTATSGRRDPRGENRFYVGGQDTLNRLNKAVALGDISEVKAILQTDIDVTQENEWGASPIQMAKSHERAEILAMLLAHQRSRSEATDHAVA